MRALLPMAVTGLVMGALLWAVSAVLLVGGVQWGGVLAIRNFGTVFFGLGIAANVSQVLVGQRPRSPDVAE